MTAWMPMYWGDYLRDTQHLSTMEHGAYLLLIAHYWNTQEALPDDDERLRRITRTTTKEWNSIKSVLREFFESHDGKLHHDRLNQELDRSKAYSTSQSERAQLRAKNHTKQRNAPSRGKPDAEPTTTTTTEEVKEGDKSPSKKGRSFPLIDVTLDANAEWLAEKRAQGKYLHHDEQFILETFINYCKSKGKNYVDHLAAYRNAFGWDRCQPVSRRTQSHQGGAYQAGIRDNRDPAARARDAGEAIIAKRQAERAAAAMASEADQRERGGARSIDETATPSLFGPEKLR